MRDLHATARRRALFAVAAAFVIGPVLAASGAGDVFSKIERGRWLVRSGGGGSGDRSICLGDPAQLIQLEHKMADCKQEPLAADPDGATIQYSCVGHGYGHTTLRLDTPRVATIETQGLIDGRPFAYRATARKTGPC